MADRETIAMTMTREQLHVFPSWCQAGMTLLPILITCCGRGVDGMTALQRPHYGVVGASTTGRKGDGGVGRAAELSGAQRLGGGRAEERHWGCGLSGAALLGQEGNGIRLKKGSDNQHIVGGGVWQCTEVGGGTASATVDVV